MDLIAVLKGFAIALGIFGIVVAVAAVVGIVYGIRRLVYAIRGEEYVPLLGAGKMEYQHLDIDAGTTEEEIEKVLLRYGRLDGVGRYAKTGYSAITSSRRKAQVFEGSLENRFERGTISWDKFASASELVHQAILRNCALLGNRVQAFDRAEYRRLNRVFKSTRPGQDETAIISATDTEKWNLLQSSIAEMKRLNESNNALLLEFDKLNTAVSKLTNVNSADESEQLLNEIHTLIDETRYYDRKLRQMD